MIQSTIISLFNKITDFYGTKGALLRSAHKLSLPLVSSLDVESVFWSRNLRLEEIQSIELSKRESGSEFREQISSLLASLFVQTESINTTIYLSQLSGFFASKSSGLWKNLSEFADHIQASNKVNAYCHIKCESIVDFNVCVQHCFPGEGPFKIKYCSWDNKYFWMNENGSHHLGAAFGYAKYTSEDYSIPAVLARWSINEEAANLLNRQFTCMIVKADGYELQDLMKKFDVPFQSVKFVTPFSDHEVLFLPNNNKWSNIMSTVFDELISRGMAHSFGKLIMDLVNK
jgi:hypothetical protein